MSQLPLESIEIIEKTIIGQLNDFLNKEGKHKSSKWCTTEIKRIIGAIGIQHDFWVSTSGANDYESEWLYDIIWYSNNDKGFNRLVLAAECEFSRGLEHIKYDFEKLLVTNAEMKIMICMSLGKGPGIEKIYQQCKVALENYELLPKGTRILSGAFIPKILTK